MKKLFMRTKDLRTRIPTTTFTCSVVCRVAAILWAKWLCVRGVTMSHCDGNGFVVFYAEWRRMGAIQAQLKDGGSLNGRVRSV